MSFLKIEKLKNIFNDDDNVKEYEYLNIGSVVVCIVKDILTNKFVCVEQFRPGPNKNIVQFVAGRVEKDESFWRTVFREIKEETGQDAIYISCMSKWFSSPGITNEFVYSFYTEVEFDINKTKLIDTEINSVEVLDLDSVNYLIEDAHSLLTYHKYLEYYGKNI